MPLSQSSIAFPKCSRRLARAPIALSGWLLVVFGPQAIKDDAAHPRRCGHGVALGALLDISIKLLSPVQNNRARAAPPNGRNAIGIGHGLGPVHSFAFAV
jgi:hypothetical protein